MFENNNADNVVPADMEPQNVKEFFKANAGLIATAAIGSAVVVGLSVYGHVLRKRAEADVVAEAELIKIDSAPED